jgi:WD40 repeat protein
MVSGHGNVRVSHAAWSPDGTKIVTILGDDAARVWNPTTGEMIEELGDHSGPVIHAAWSPDGTKVVTEFYDPDGTTPARVWDAATGERLEMLEVHDASVARAAWGPGGAMTVTTGEPGVEVRDATTGRLLFDLPWITDATWSPEGTRTLKVTEVAWSPGETRARSILQVSNMVTRGALAPARLAETTTGPVRAELLTSTGVVLRVTPRPDGASTRVDPRRIWLALTGGTLDFDSGCAPAWSPDGSKVATGDKVGIAHVRDAVTGELLAQTTGPERGVVSVTWSPDGTRLATVDIDGTAQVWCAATGEPLTPMYKVSSARSNQVAWSPDGSMLATAEGLDTGRESGVGSVAWSPDGTILATVEPYRAVRVWSATGESLATITGHMVAVAWSRDAKLATVADDGTLRVWSATGESPATITGHTNGVTSVAWSHDGTMLATGGQDRIVRVWGATGEPLATITGHTYSVSSLRNYAIHSLAWSRDGTKLASTDGETVRVWSTAAWQAPPILLRGGYHIAFDRDGERIATAGGILSSEPLRDQLWRATTCCLSAARRMELLDEDEVTAGINAKAHREEEARRRTARPSFAVEIPTFEERRRRSEAAIAAAVAAERAVAVEAAAAEATAPEAPAETAMLEAPAETTEPQAPAEAAETESAPPALAELAAATGAAGAGTAEMAMVLGELRALFQGAEHKVGELLERLARRPDGER